MGTTHVLVLILCLGVLACTGKKQTLEDKVDDTEKIEELYATEQTMDTIIPDPGIKYRESRKIDPQNPPSVIDIEMLAGNKDFDLNQFYSEVEYVKLNHPLAGQQIGFLGNSTYEISYERGMTSGRGLNSSVFFSKDKIVAGDAYFGYHCFDLQGNYLSTIAAKKDIPGYDINNNRVSVTFDTSTDQIAGFSMLDDNCLFLKVINRKGAFYFHNISSQKNYVTRPASFGRSMLLSPDKYVGFGYNPGADQHYPLMYSFNITGDTLCQFMNYNPLVEISNRQAYTNPETSDFYYYNEKLTMRQAYNDTIYRVDMDRLTPVFILNMGSKKPDVQTALQGNKEGKIFINNLLETDDFLFIIHTENYDCPNNRNNGSVKFFYSYFDKNEKKRYAIPGTLFPEVFTLKNSIPNTIPLLVNNAKAYGNKLYAAYTKIQLKEIIASKDFSSFPEIQQEKINELYNELSDYGLLIMILKK
jgi:hypothetical protein